MRGVFSGSRRAAAAWLLMVTLVAPSSLASDTSGDAGLWAEFITWAEARLDVPGGFTLDEEGFSAWLMARIWVPGG